MASLLALLLWQSQRGWGHGGGALAIPALGAELFFLDVPAIVRAGPTRLAVIRVGSGVRFEPHTYLDEGLFAPVPIETWARLLRAPVVFNAGQFDDHLRHLGWLKSERGWLEPVRKAAFKGLLVSDPVALVPSVAGVHRPQNAIVDLERSEASVAEQYKNVVQSMMLLDEGRQVRVRRTDRAACRTVVAENSAGELLVIASEGAVTLHELAAWLPYSGLHVVRAINLDGGVESQLAVDTGREHIALIGRYGHDSALALRPSVTPAPLPAVVAIYPRARAMP